MVYRLSPQLGLPLPERARNLAAGSASREHLNKAGLVIRAAYRGARKHGYGDRLQGIASSSPRIPPLTVPACC
jgi:hypothetical protein